MVTAIEGGPERQELVERHTQSVDISPLVDHPAPGQRLLGAHVAERANHIAGLRQTEIAPEIAPVRNR